MDGLTNRRTSERTDGRTKPLIKLRVRNLELAVKAAGNKKAGYTDQDGALKITVVYI